MYQQSPSVVHSFRQHWPNIQPMLKRLINNESISVEEWQNLFCDVHMICSWDDKGPFRLLKALEFELRDSFLIKTKARLKSIEDDQQQLKEYNECWEEYSQHCMRLPLAFQQLDLATKDTVIEMRWPDKNSFLTYPTKKASGSTVRTLMLKLWDRYIVSWLEDRLRASAMNLLLAERAGRIIDPRLIIGLRDSFAALNFSNIDEHRGNYTRSLEASYIEALEIYYSPKASDYMKENSLTDYIRWAIKKLDKEEERARLYLDTKSDAFKDVSEACSRVLVKDFVEQVLLDSRMYIASEDMEMMRLIFSFISKTEQEFKHELLLHLRGHIYSTGISRLMSNEWSLLTKSEKFVENVVEFYDRFIFIIQTSFNGDEEAKEMLNQAFGWVINCKNIFTNDLFPDDSAQKTPSSNKQIFQPESRCAELLANYCDLLLRRTSVSRKLTTEELDNRLKRVLLIVNFIKNKEAFLRYHRTLLARRLILDTTFNFETEERFVRHLRQVQEMPLENLSKLRRMFKDMKVSAELQKSFHNLENTSSNNNNEIIPSKLHTMELTTPDQENNNSSFVEQLDSMNTLILNPSAWTKINENYTINLPDSVKSTLPSYEALYKSRYDGRSLEWYPQLSNGLITMTTDKGIYDLEITAAQLSILSAFNQKPRAAKTVIELEEASNLNSVELRRTIWSLISNPKLKMQIMNCKPQAVNFKDLDNELNQYTMNHDFVLIKNGQAQSKGRISLIGRLQI